MANRSRSPMERRSKSRLVVISQNIAVLLGNPMAHSCGCHLPRRDEPETGGAGDFNNTPNRYVVANSNGGSSAYPAQDGRWVRQNTSSVAGSAMKYLASGDFNRTQTRLALVARRIPRGSRSCSGTVGGGFGAPKSYETRVEPNSSASATNGDGRRTGGADLSSRAPDFQGRAGGTSGERQRTKPTRGRSARHRGLDRRR